MKTNIAMVIKYISSIIGCGVFVMCFILVIIVGSYPSGAAEMSVVSSKKGVTVISVIGKLKINDHKAFLDLAITADKAVVAFHSPGGNLRSGIEIGKIIHLKEFDTIVVENSICASACAIAWLGGVRKYMMKGSQIGFHAAFEQDGPEIRNSSVGNALTGAFLSKIGLGQRAIVYITQTDPTSMKWLSIDDAKSLGIAVSYLKSKPDKKAKSNFSEQKKGILSPGRLPVVVGSSLDRALEALRAGMLYSKAQEILISAGWQPHRHPWQNRGCSPGRNDVCERYPEAVSCAGTGVGYCKFRFSDHNRRTLFLATIGEEVGNLGLERWWIGNADGDAIKSRKQIFKSGGTERRRTKFEGMAIAFSKRYLEAWSKKNSLAIEYMRSSYANTVLFYGKKTSYDKIIKAKIKFTKRWPYRDYKIINNTLKAICMGEYCTVSGHINWKTYGRKYKRMHRGVADFVFKWNALSQKITSETGKVLSIEKIILEP